MTDVPPAPPGPILRLLATTDLHLHLTSHDYAADRPAPDIGLTRTAQLIAQARAEATVQGATVLLFDNGDGMQGTPLAGCGDDEAVHPLMQAFAYLRYDAIGLGNHDFNFGLEALNAALADCPCPVVSSNLRPCCPDLLVGPVRQAVLDRTVHMDGTDHDLRIGVLSVLPPQTVYWDARHLRGRIAIEDMVTTVRAAVPGLRGAVCDVIVLLAHTGIGAPEHLPGQENALLPLCAVPGLDAIFAGHTHQTIPSDGPETGENSPAVAMAGYAGSHLAQIDLTLSRGADTGWQVLAHDTRLRPIAQRTPQGEIRPLVSEDAGLKRCLAPYHKRAQTDLARPVGSCDHPLHSYFSFVAPDSAMHLIAEAQVDAAAPHLATSDVADLPVLSAVAPGRFGGRSGPLAYTDIAPGPVTRRSLEDLVVFPNEIEARILTGAQIVNWLHSAADLFHQIPPKATKAALINPDRPGHEFDVIFGLRYVIDLSVAPGPDTGRVHSVTWQGHSIDPNQGFVVVMNSYRANGGGDVAAIGGTTPVPLPPLSMRDAVAARLGRPRAMETARFHPTSWHFAPQPGASVILHTGPGARPHLEELHHYAPRDLGIGSDGFVRLVLSL